MDEGNRSWEDMRRTESKRLTDAKKEEHGEESEPEHRVTALVDARHIELPERVPENLESKVRFKCVLEAAATSGRCETAAR